MKRGSPKLSAQILEEASDWFVEFSEGSVEPAARERFDTWLRRSPEHVQAYLKITALWEDASLLQKGRTLESDELVARALTETNVVSLAATGAAASGASGGSEGGRVASAANPRSAAKARRLSRSLAIAASVLVVIAAGSWLYIQRGTYTTGIGEQRSVRLDDGSTVELNSRSRVRVRFSGRERSVELLEGQALFRVAKDKDRPFVVDTSDTHVRAVGTQFDVYRKGTGTIVTVLEGRVAVLSAGVGALPELAEARPHTERLAGQPTSIAPNRNTTASATVGRRSAHRGSEILLAAGEQLTVGPRAVSQPTAADLTVATAWTQRKIAFQGAPLSEVVEQFNRYNPRQMVIADPGLESTRISGVFSSTDPDSLLRFLRELPNFTVEESSREIRILSK